jgi:hypothetical protein
LSTPVLIRHLWKFKTVVFLHWCLIHTVLLDHKFSFKVLAKFGMILGHFFN